MLSISQVKGAIFDLDDTLLDNGPADQPADWLHSRSRLAAVHAVAKERSIPSLLSLTKEQNAVAFSTAPTHSLAGAIWNIFQMTGYKRGDIDVNDPVLLEIARRKNELHEAILLKYGKELPGASAFVRRLAAQGVDRLALATSAVRRDIDLFLDNYQLHDLFPAQRIISAEQVSRPKPDPQSFDLAFKTLGLPDNARQSVLAFEDNPRGVESAKTAGLFVCAITKHFKRDDQRLFEAGPDLIADSYAEFARLLGLTAKN